MDKGPEEISSGPFAFRRAELKISSRGITQVLENCAIPFLITNYKNGAELEK
jgi:hypothetical protein